MKFIFLAFAMIVSACAPAVSPDSPALVTEEVTEETRIVAALSYADWCGSCKALDPKLATLRTEGDVEGVAHIILNYTDRDEDAYYAVADAAGVGQAVRNNLADGIWTGGVMVIDLNSQTVVEVLDRSMSVEEMRDVLEAAVAGV